MDRHVWEEHNYCKRSEIWNETCVLETEEVVRAIKELKDNKALGITNIKAEMWKAMLKEIGGEIIKKPFEKVMEGKIPDSWKRSRVKLLPKNEKTEVEIKDFRPCLLYTSPSPRDLSTSRMPSSA